MLRIATGCLFVALFVPAFAGEDHPAKADPEYVRITTERAQKIVAKLGIDDVAKAVRVQETIARQYRDLQAIHAQRDAGLAAATLPASGDRAAVEAARATLQRESEFEQYRLHYAFLARLGAELTALQVEQVKDGLTFQVVPITFHRYQQLLPSLSDEQRRMIHALLLEAREHAMDAGTSEAKHAVFGKYKGRINNHLSAAGFDLKAAERALQARERSTNTAP
jgi:hypothetical protein